MKELETFREMESENKISPELLKQSISDFKKEQEDEVEIAKTGFTPSNKVHV